MSMFIYALLDADGNYCYVGKSKNPKRRFREHKAAGHILAEVPVLDGMAAEKRFIALFRVQGCVLRNKNGGGSGPTQHTLETCAKIGLASRGRTSWNKGKTSWNKGKQHSSETRAKISAVLKGKTFSAERRAKLSAAKKGRPGRAHSAETLVKMSGEKHHNFGKKASPETRAKMSASHNRRLASLSNRREL